MVLPVVPCLMVVRSTTPTLGIAVVHYRAPALALDCLRRIRRAAPDAAVVVVDTSPEAEFERALQLEHPNVSFLPASNHSYSHAVNVGLRELDASYLVLMNADVLVEEDTFRDLLAVMARHPDCGAVGPLARLPSGEPQPLGVPYRRYYRRLLADSAGPGTQPPTSLPVRWLSGCLQLVRREAWLASGGYDETLRFFNEDLDFCLRLARDGWHTRLVSTPVVHIGGSSTPDHPAFHVEGRRGGLIVTKRYYPRPIAWLQQAFLWSEALTGVLLARKPELKVAHQRMLALLRSGDFDRSPFGATLDDRG